MKKVFGVLCVLLIAASAFAGVVDFTVTVDVSKEPAVCATATSVNCLASTQLYYMQGANRVNVAQANVPTAATGVTAISVPAVPVKTYGNITFFAVMQGRDGSGALVESNPTSAAPVVLRPGAATSVGVVVQ